MDPIRQAGETRPIRSLDETDLGILVALQADGRSSTAELARRGGRAENTVRHRMDLLASSRIIRSYQADVDLDLVGETVEAIVQGASDLRELPRLRAQLTAMPCVLAADVVSGDRSIVIHLIAKSITDLGTILSRDIAPLGLEDADVHLILRSLVRLRAPDLVALIGPRLSLLVPFSGTAAPDEAGLLRAVAPVV